jgi:hypothetical protein
MNQRKPLPGGRYGSIRRPATAGGGSGLEPPAAAAAVSAAAPSMLGVHGGHGGYGAMALVAGPSRTLLYSWHFVQCQVWCRIVRFSETLG